MNNKIETFLDLKNFTNSLNEEQLSQPVQYWGESKCGIITYAEILKDDYINPSGDGCEPKSNYDNDEDYDMSDEPIVFTNGTVILSVE